MDYATLVSTVTEAWAADGDTEFSAYLPRAVDLAEEKLTRRLDSYGMVVWTEASISASAAFVSVPSGIRILKSVTYVSSGRADDLLLRTDEYLRQYWPTRTNVGTPKYYAKRGAATIYLAPTPAADAALEFSGVVRPEALSSVSATNWFTQYASRGLFYATMLEMAVWSKNASAIAAWTAALEDELAVLREEDRRNRRDDQEPASAKNGGDNTLGGR